MEIERLWDANDKLMPQYEIAFDRLDNTDIGTIWRFTAKDTSNNYDEEIIDVDRKQLKDLNDAIEQELYPERFVESKTARQAKVRIVLDYMRELGFSETEMNSFIRRAREIKSW